MGGTGFRVFSLCVVLAFVRGAARCVLVARLVFMRILVTFAVEAEFAPWRGRHEFLPAQTSSNGQVYTTSLSGVDVLVGLTGIGPRAAADSIRAFTWAGDLDLCLTTGFAGALRPEHRVADILAAREIVAHDKRSNIFDGKIQCTQRLLKMAAACGARVVERFYSSPSLIRMAKEKSALRDLADAVEMESFEVLAEAFAWMPEGIAVRAVSDTVDEDLPLDFSQMVIGQGELSMARLAAQIVRKPSAIPGLIRLGKRSSEAAEKLADFLDTFLAALAGKSVAIASKEAR